MAPLGGLWLMGSAFAFVLVNMIFSPDPDI
jgi:hypothetical protein